MEWTLVFGEWCGAAVVRTRGVFDVADHRRMVAEIVAHDEWRPGQPILFDHRQLSFEGARYADMLNARDNHVAHEGRIGSARSAILMKSAADYGIGRQFQNLAAGHLSAELQVFTDEALAREWLCASEQGAADSPGRTESFRHQPGATMSTPERAASEGPLEAGTGHVHVDSEDALQEELRRESAEGSDAIGDIADNRNVTGSSSWVTQGEPRSDEDGDRPDPA